MAFSYLFVSFFSRFGATVRYFPWRFAGLIYDLDGFSFK